jgi:hypothetical protein
MTELTGFDEIDDALRVFRPRGELEHLSFSIRAAAHGGEVVNDRVVRFKTCQNLAVRFDLDQFLPSIQPEGGDRAIQPSNATVFLGRTCQRGFADAASLAAAERS